MQKIIITILLILSHTSVFAKNMNRKDYPYALLTEDYSILTTSDLAMNSCGADAIPFSNRNLAYPYWKCFEVSKAKIECDNSGHISGSKEENALLTITIQDPESEHFYLPRRAMGLNNCHWFQKRWKSAIKGEKHICISGTFTDYETENGHRTSLWVFDKFKTKKSCTSYFADQCDLKTVRKNGCQI